MDITEEYNIVNGQYAAGNIGKGVEFYGDSAFQYCRINKRDGLSVKIAKWDSQSWPNTFIFYCNSSGIIVKKDALYSELSNSAYREFQLDFPQDATFVCVNSAKTHPIKIFKNK